MDQKNKDRKGGLSRIKYLAYALLFFVILIAVAKAQATQISTSPLRCLSNTLIGSQSNNSPTTFLYSCINSWSVLSVIIVALLFSFFMIALAYLIGQVLNIEQLRGWYKNESWELVKTIFLIAIIFLLITIMSNIALGFNMSNPPPSSSSCPSFDIIYCSASQYLQDQTVLSQDALVAVTGMSIGIQDAKSLSLDEGIYVFFTIPYTDTKVTYIYGLTNKLLKSDVLETSPFTGDSYVKNTFLLLISPIYMLTNVLYDIFYVIVYLSLGVLIPIGIVFRAIPFLRGVGGTIIALGITGAILFPLTLVVLNAPISNFFYTNYYKGAPSIPPVTNGCSNSGYLGYICDLTARVPQSIFNFMDTVISGFFGAPGANGYASATNGALFNGVIVTVNMLNYYTLPLVVDFILFIADFVLVYALAQGVATQLGGSLRLSLGNKIKMA